MEHHITGPCHLPLADSFSPSCRSIRALNLTAGQPTPGTAASRVQRPRSASPRWTDRSIGPAPLLPGHFYSRLDRVLFSLEGKIGSTFSWPRTGGPTIDLFQKLPVRQLKVRILTGFQRAEEASVASRSSDEPILIRHSGPPTSGRAS